MMGALQSSGLIGGLVGLAFGVADWLIFMFLIKPKLEQTERTGAWQGRGRWTSLAAFKGAFLLFCFVVLPTVGYVIGRLFGPIFVGSGG